MPNSIIRLLTASVLVLVLTARARAAHGLHVVFVTSETGLGDRSFNDMVLLGLKRAKQALGVQYAVIQPRSVSEFRSSLARAAGQGFDLVIGTSFDMLKPMQEIARAFPEQKFGLIDVGPEPVAPNVASTLTKDWQGAFIVGWIAAKCSHTGTIGFVGGKEIPIIRRYFAGYYYGAKTASPLVDVLETYTGSFNDPAGGKEYTLTLIDRKSDINIGVAGATSAGVIDAARSSGTLAIGIDSNQDYLAPGHVLTSLVKHVDGQAYDMITSVQDGTFKGGEVKVYGLDEHDGMSISLDQYNRGLIPADVLAALPELEKQVRTGRIVVPNYFDLKPHQAQMGDPPIPVPSSLSGTG